MTNAEKIAERMADVAWDALGSPNVNVRKAITAALLDAGLREAVDILEMAATGRRVGLSPERAASALSALLGEQP